MSVRSEQLPVEAYSIILIIVCKRLFCVFELVWNKELINIYEQSPVIVFAEFAEEVVVCGNLLAHSRKVNEMDIVWNFFFEVPVVLVDVYFVKANPMMISEPLAQVVILFASYCY